MVEARRRRIVGLGVRPVLDFEQRHAAGAEPDEAVAALDDRKSEQALVVAGEKVEIAHDEPDRADMQRGAARKGRRRRWVRGVHGRYIGASEFRFNRFPVCAAALRERYFRKEPLPPRKSSIRQASPIFTRARTIGALPAEASFVNVTVATALAGPTSWTSTVNDLMSKSCASMKGSASKSWRFAAFLGGPGVGVDQLHQRGRDELPRAR